MRLTRLSLGVALAVLAGVITGVGPVAGAAGAGIPLPFAHFSHMVVDGVHGHVFLSGGAGSDGLLVTDLDGNTVATIASEPGATALALSGDGGTLFAALTGSDAISVIDTGTLKETARDGTGTGTSPSSLAVAGGRVWFGYGTVGAGGIGSLDVSGAQPEVALDQDPGPWGAPPLLATTPGPSGLLVAGAAGADSAAFAVFDVSAGAVKRTASATLGIPDLADFAVSADGQDVLAGSWGGGVRTSAYRTSDLLPDPDDPGRILYPAAVAVAPDGTVAASADDQELDVFAARGARPLNSYEASEGSRLAVHGAAWDPDGSRLFAVTTDNTSGSPALRVIQGPEVAETRAWASPEVVKAKPGESVAGTLTIETAGVPFLAPVAHVRRIDAAHPDGVALPDPVYTAGTLPVFSGGFTSVGSFSFSDTPPSQGEFSYRIDYTGDASHQAATGTVLAEVAKGAPAVTLTAPAKSGRTAPITIRGQLSTGPYASGEIVHVTRTDLAHPAGVPLRDVPVSADGTFEVADAPPVGGANTYTVRYPGDKAHLAASGAATVQVSRAATHLTLTTNARTYAYLGQAKAAVHLGTTYDSRTVAIYAQPSGGRKVLLKSGKVDAHGNLVVGYKLSHTTVFSAAFAGDYRYAPATATHSVGVHARVTDTLRLYDQSTRHGGKLYRVYIRDDPGRAPQFMAEIAPKHPGQCLFVTLQRFRSGSWHTISTSQCQPLGSGPAGSAAVVWLPWKSMPNGALYRVRAEYVHDGKDTTNLNTDGSWEYLTTVAHPA
ncbi:hypothetical protein [Actinacidiphila oryziradicis]|uniref:Ig-like domain repeat protein n=1 Tax=Actinacidiphila oryziradicis TaxID=2571141 RepID=A0A4U0RIU8_9ACTN|nr:hypothetical protein [Actinacidiphila oryziradicis]TJZ95167.1 hypothetical protein FCI23_52525 [Actinacidiphila oryziradicis]